MNDKNNLEANNYKTVPPEWSEVIDEDTIARCISRISYEIVEQKRHIERLAIVGIRTGGEFLGQRIKRRIEEIEGHQISFGVIDITLYRDDLSQANTQPSLKGTDLNFPISGSRIILVDDVLYTGRTIRAALDAIIDFGRPTSVELAVLVDRGHRELPIRADYVGKNLPTAHDQSVRVRFSEAGYKDAVYLVDHKR